MEFSPAERVKSFLLDAIHPFVCSENFAFLIFARQTRENNYSVFYALNHELYFLITYPHLPLADKIPGYIGMLIYFSIYLFLPTVSNYLF